MNKYLDSTCCKKFFSDHEEEEINDLIRSCDGALYDGTDLVAFIDNDTEEYTVKEGTKRILDEAFLGKKNLRKVILPNSLEIIGNKAFMKSGICEINLPLSIKAIKNEAFMNCKLLKKLEIHEGLLVCGTSVFAGCDELEYVRLPNDMYHIPDWTFFSNCKLREVKLPSNLLSIGNHAFGACFALEQIAMPKTISSIGIAAFSNCHNIKKIVFPSSLKKIDGRCFHFCDSLNEVVLPEHISFIGVQAFDKCPNIHIYIRKFGFKHKASRYLATALASSKYYYANGKINKLENE